MSTLGALFALPRRVRAGVRSHTFDREHYARVHEDVQKAIEAGEFEDGLHHYLTFGRKEGRARRLRFGPMAVALPGVDGHAPASRSILLFEEGMRRLRGLLPGELSHRLHVAPSRLADVASAGAPQPGRASAPELKLRPPRSHRIASYHWLSIRIDRRDPTGFATLRVDLQDGAGEGETYDLFYRRGLVARRLVRLDGDIEGLRFSPVEGPAPHRIRRLRLRPARRAKAMAAMLRRLHHHHPVHRGQDDGVIRATLAAEAGKKAEPLESTLWRAYRETFRAPVERADYTTWQRRIEAPHLADLDRNADAILSSLRKLPTVSVLLPTYETPPELLEACIESVLSQSYPHLELCIADDASRAPHVRRILEAARTRDARVKLLFRERNGHICATSNDALSLATGEYIALLDHDDLLAKHALLQVAMAANEYPEASLIYGDEDKLSPYGERKNPHFKPDWNPELLLSHCYIGHLVVARRDHVLDVGGFREGTDGSQDHDLLLRLTDDLAPERIVHVPWILYHWREVEGSTAGASDAKDYTARVGLLALQDALARRGEPATATFHPTVPNAYRVQWEVPRPAPLVSLMIPTRDGGEKLRTCVTTILEKTTYAPFELLLIDNGSEREETHAFFDRVSEDPRVRVLRYDHPFNYSAINNFGASHAKGQLLALVNDDIEPIDGDWLTEMVALATRPGIGCVGAKLLYPDNTIQHAGVILGIGGVAGHSHKHLPDSESGYFSRPHLLQELSAVTAACLVVRKSIYQEVGGLDEEHLKVAFNDVDFCLKARQAGYRNVYTPHARLYHHESASRGVEDSPEKLARFSREIQLMQRRWPSPLRHDSAYSSHLSVHREDFSITNDGRCRPIPATRAELRLDPPCPVDPSPHESASRWN